MRIGTDLDSRRKLKVKLKDAIMNGLLDRGYPSKLDSEGTIVLEFGWKGAWRKFKLRLTESD